RTECCERCQQPTASSCGNSTPCATSQRSTVSRHEAAQWVRRGPRSPVECCSSAPGTPALVTAAAATCCWRSKQRKRHLRSDVCNLIVEKRRRDDAVVKVREIELFVGRVSVLIR